MQGCTRPVTHIVAAIHIYKMNEQSVDLDVFLSKRPKKVQERETCDDQTFTSSQASRRQWIPAIRSNKSHPFIPFSPTQPYMQTHAASTKISFPSLLLPFLVL
jgi:hypothetical protein